MKALFFFLAILQLIFAGSGQFVTCSSSSSNNCVSACPTAPTGCIWQGSPLNNCFITDCSLCQSSANTSDQYCQSCSVSSGKYSNAAQTACVNPQYSCTNRGSQLWTDSDCNQCYNSSYFANGSGTQCIQSSASCTNRGTQVWTSQDCLSCFNKQAVVNNTCYSKVIYISLAFMISMLL
ncbi:cell surface immobilization antigen (macronuclear) [Tetrahymena thermophila SB210]|uniref:Cell surface immobilization antigen n=1 Tax=Tetrahymena thermophila (strain SB210) TaxID=312017 RepID=Q22TF4_TETTS|nr:cell surface immobilization antigen [Tetrahymena thermophila SB210]EAR88484.1 cell surface immobilization antigen [Tetrahymena thermophila SB210]|eukprot:XP_001008729.1 cell surface immobilization antigen [Tetrahymena thermophila SB210]